jgi:hypothetical protein
MQVIQGSTTVAIVFLMISSTDHISPLTGASPTVVLSKDGGAFATPAGVVSEIANGWYKISANAVDTNTVGPLILHATAMGGDPTDELIDVLYPFVALGATTYTNIVGNIQGSVGSVTNPVTCKGAPKLNDDCC